MLNGFSPRLAFRAVRRAGIETITFPELGRTYVTHQHGLNHIAYNESEIFLTIGTAKQCRAAIFADACLAA